MLADVIRERTLKCLAWLRTAFPNRFVGTTVAVSHLAPTLRSVDLRFVHQEVVNCNQADVSSHQSAESRMSRSSLRRRLRSQITTTPASAMTPSATPATKLIESRLIFPLSFHNSATPMDVANALRPVTSFILGAFDVSLFFII